MVTQFLPLVLAANTLLVDYANFLKTSLCVPTSHLAGGDEDPLPPQAVHWWRFLESEGEPVRRAVLDLIPGVAKAFAASAQPDKARLAAYLGLQLTGAIDAEDVCADHLPRFGGHDRDLVDNPHVAADLLQYLPVAERAAVGEQLALQRNTPEGWLAAGQSAWAAGRRARSIAFYRYAAVVADNLELRAPKMPRKIVGSTRTAEIDDFDRIDSLVYDLETIERATTESFSGGRCLWSEDEGAGFDTMLAISVRIKRPVRIADVELEQGDRATFMGGWMRRGQCLTYRPTNLASIEIARPHPAFGWPAFAGSVRLDVEGRVRTLRTDVDLTLHGIKVLGGANVEFYPNGHLLYATHVAPQRVGNVHLVGSAVVFNRDGQLASFVPAEPFEWAGFAAASGTRITSSPMPFANPGTSCRAAFSPEVKLARYAGSSRFKPVAQARGLPRQCPRSREVRLHRRAEGPLPSHEAVPRFSTYPSPDIMHGRSVRHRNERGRTRV